MADRCPDKLERFARIVYDEWKESEHPRDEDGQFTKSMSASNFSDNKENARKSENEGDTIDWPKKGENISSATFKKLREYAGTKGLVLEEFKKSDIDSELAYEVIDELTRLRKKYFGGVDQVFTLRLEPMRSIDFAKSYPGKPDLIEVNPDAFRNKEKLKQEYEKLESDGWFVKGSTYRSIISHEIGHIYEDLMGISGLEIMKEVLGENDTTKVLKKCTMELSGYSGSLKDGSEIISEVFSAYESGDRRDFILKFMKKCGIIF